MFFKQSNYEVLLSEYSNREGAIALLRQYRSYLEMIPSLRRPQESLITIPLPVIILHIPKDSGLPHISQEYKKRALRLPCDLAILMCDPEWKIKIGVEILVFIHRPDEDFSQLLERWRQTQIFLHTNYEWLMPISHEHMFSDVAEKICPLFVLLKETPERIKRGLTGAGLPFVIDTVTIPCESEKTSIS